MKQENTHLGVDFYYRDSSNLFLSEKGAVCVPAYYLRVGEAIGLADDGGGVPDAGLEVSAGGPVLGEDDLLYVFVLHLLQLHH